MLELLRESVIVQALLTLSLALAVIYQSITTGNVDPLLSNAFLITMGFYFGGKVQTGISSVMRRITESQDK